MIGTGRSALLIVSAWGLLPASGSGVLDDRGFDEAPFTEEANGRGVVCNRSEEENVWFGTGVAFVDLNNNGFPDIVCVGAADGLIGIFENDGSGHFIDRSDTSGIPLSVHARGICAADFNNDGLIDLYITRRAAPNLLLRNDGNFTFTDVAAEFGVAGDSLAWNKGCSWGDYDGDRWPDLAVSNYIGRNALYQNVQGESFTDVTVEVGADTGVDRCFQVVFFDYDLDGQLDLYAIHDTVGQTCTSLHNRLLRNSGGMFVDVSVEAGVATCMDSMSATIGDLTGNGWPDIFVTNVHPGSRLHCHQGNLTFELCNEAAGVTDTGSVGWGAAFFDYNNDSWLDLFVSRQTHPNRLFRGGPIWPMVDSAPALNVNTGGETYAVAIADINGNGVLDLAVKNRDQPLRIFINNNSGVKNWAKFDVVGEGIQHFGIGARLDLRTASHWQQRQVLAGSNYLTQDHLVQHFGLDEAIVIDELIVTWPGGHTRTLINLSVNQTWTIYPQDKLGDGNFDGQVMFADFLIFADCYFASVVAGSISPGCEMMDVDGDGVVDLEDFDSFVLVYEDELEDCNENGIPDLREILSDPSLDESGDWALDDCGSTLPGDVNGDGIVNVQDLLLVISHWGSCGDCPPACAGDANEDCQVNVQDLLIVISNWGNTQS